MQVADELLPENQLCMLVNEQDERRGLPFVQTIPHTAARRSSLRRIHRSIAVAEERLLLHYAQGTIHSALAQSSSGHRLAEI